MENPQREKQLLLTKEFETFFEICDVCNLLSREIQIIRFVNRFPLGETARRQVLQNRKTDSMLNDLDTAYRLATADWWRQSNKLIGICKSYRR